IRVPEHSPARLPLRLAHQVVEVEVALDHPSDQVADRAEERDDQHVAEVANDQGESEQQPGDQAHCSTAHHRRALLFVLFVCRCKPRACPWALRVRATAASLRRTVWRRTNATLARARERADDPAANASYARLPSRKRLASPPRSGWCRRAYRWNARRAWARLAPGGIPRISDGVLIGRAPPGRRRLR